jgi:hypothetical protein
MYNYKMIKIFYCFEGGKRNDKQFLLLINGSCKKNFGMKTKC